MIITLTLLISSDVHLQSANMCIGDRKNSTKNLAFLVFLSISVGVLGVPFKISSKNRDHRGVRIEYTKNFDECDCACGVSNRQMRVVGGNVTRIHEFPWIAGISKGGEFHCGASLITRRHLVTAAHCVEGFNKEDLLIVLADHDRDSEDRLSSITVRGVKRIKQHEEFDIYTFNNDIALLELNEPVDFDTKIQPVCLPNSDITDYSGRTAIVAGWGRTGEKHNPSRILRKAPVPVWTRKECLSSGYLTKKITENMFCAGYFEGKTDACQGDSGGPLHMSNQGGDMELIGLVSWGRGCGRPNFPGIYTKVTNYLDWIHKNLKGQCLCTPSYQNPRHAKKI